MNYETKTRLLGLPVLHVATGQLIDGSYRRGVAKGWVAIGDISFGVVFSAGGVSVGGDRIVSMIDEFPIFCVAAAVADGETVIRDAQELRLKESDRIAVMAAELRKFGVAIEELPDGVRITGGRPLRGAVGSSHGDHRIAMALAVAGLVAEGETIVEDVDCIETSFPGFAEIFRRLGADVTRVEG